jgi:hypothetical protein
VVGIAVVSRGEITGGKVCDRKQQQKHQQPNNNNNNNNIAVQLFA